MEDVRTVVERGKEVETGLRSQVETCTSEIRDLQIENEHLQNMV